MNKKIQWLAVVVILALVAGAFWWSRNKVAAPTIETGAGSYPPGFRPPTGKPFVTPPPGPPPAE